jgi:predicted DNA-binding protein
MTLRLPRELYERLRLEAFQKHVSQAEIIREALAERYERAGGRL